MVVDQFTKYGHFVPMKHLYSANSIVELFAKEVVQIHSILKSIISDYDLTFISHF